MKRFSSISLFFILFMASFNVTLATTYYVDGQNGNDNNSGTSTSTAWRHIQYGVTRATTGDILTCSGTFNETVTVNVVNLTIQGNSPTNHATLSGSSLSITTGFRVISYSCKIKYFDIMNYRDESGFNDSAGVGIFTHSRSNHEFTDLNISNCNNGITILESSTVKILRCYFSNMYLKSNNTTGGCGVSAISRSTTASLNNILIGSDDSNSGNKFENCAGDCIEFICTVQGNVNSDGGLIKYNSFIQGNDKYCVRLSRINGIFSIESNKFKGPNLWTSYGSAGGSGNGIILDNYDMNSFDYLFIMNNNFEVEGNIVIKAVNTNFPGSLLYEFWTANNNTFYSQNSVLHTSALVDPNLTQILPSTDGSISIKNTIAGSVANAPNYSTVKVSSGTYYENQFNLNKITLMGSLPTDIYSHGTGSNPPIIDGNNSSTAFVFSGGSSEVFIIGFELRNLSYGVTSNTTSNYISDIYFQNNKFSNISQNAFNINGNGNSTNQMNWFVNFNIFESCGGNNIYFNSSSYLQISDNSITVGSGSSTNNGILILNSDHVNIRQNKISSIAGSAINLENVTFTDVNNNALTANSATASNSIIHIKNSTDTRVDYNNIIISHSDGQQTAGFYYGIFAEGSSINRVLVDYNYFDGNSSNTANLAIVVNQDVQDLGIGINYNYFGGFSSAIRYQPTNPLYSVKADNNWFGSANGPSHTKNRFNKNENGGHGIGVIGNVAFTPWLAGSQNTTPANATGFYPTGNSFGPVSYTNYLNYNTYYFPNIKDALAACENGTMLTIQSGTFTEVVDLAEEDHAITVNKDIDMYLIDNSVTIYGDLVFIGDPNSSTMTNISNLYGNFILSRKQTTGNSYTLGNLDVQKRKVVLHNGNLIVEAKCADDISLNKTAGSMVVLTQGTSLIQKNIPNYTADNWFYPLGVVNYSVYPNTFEEAWIEVNPGTASPQNRTEQITVQLAQNSPVSNYNRPGDDSYALMRNWSINYSNSSGSFSSGSVKFYWPLNIPQNGAGANFTNVKAFPARWNTTDNRWVSYRLNVPTTGGRSASGDALQFVKATGITKFSDWAIFSGDNSSALVNPPPRVPSLIQFSAITDEKLAFRWQNVPCNSFVVLMDEYNPTNTSRTMTLPQNGHSYAQSGINDQSTISWSSATTLPNSTVRVVYSGTSSTFRNLTVDGLKSGQSYLIGIFPANGISEDYLKYQTTYTTYNPRYESTRSRIVLAADNDNNLNFKGFCGTKDVALRCYMEGPQPFMLINFYTSKDGIVDVTGNLQNQLPSGNPKYLLYQFDIDNPKPSYLPLDYILNDAVDATGRRATLYHFKNGSLAQNGVPTTGSFTFTQSDPVPMDARYVYSKVTYNSLDFTQDYNVYKCEGETAYLNAGIITSYPQSSFRRWEYRQSSSGTWTGIESYNSLLVLTNLSPNQSNWQYRPVFSTSRTSFCNDENAYGPIATLGVSSTISANTSYPIDIDPAACENTPYIEFLAKLNSGYRSDVKFDWQYQKEGESTWTHVFDGNGNPSPFLSQNSSTVYHIAQPSDDGDLLRIGLPTFLLDNVKIRATIYRDYCNKDSRTALIKIDQVGSVSQNPSSSEICVNQSTYFNTSGAGNIKWMYKEPGSSTFTYFNFVSNRMTIGSSSFTVSGASTSSTLTLSNATASLNGYMFRAEFAGQYYSDCSKSYTQAALLNVDSSPQPSQNPENTSICESDGANLSVAWQGGTCVTSYFNWEQKLAGSATWQQIGFTNQNNIYITGLTHSINDKMEVRAAFYCGTCPTPVYSTSATVTVDVLPMVFEEPNTASICNGSQIQFTAIGSGDVQWYVSPDDIDYLPLTNGNTDPYDNPITISGATTQTLTLTTNNSLVLDQYFFKAVFTSTYQICQSVETYPANLFVSESPNSGTVSGNSSICDGSTIPITMDAYFYPSDAICYYKSNYWQYSSNNGSTWNMVTLNTQLPGNTQIESFNLVHITLTNVSYAVNGYKFREIFECYPCSQTTTTLPATVLVYKPYALISSPQTQNTTCEYNNLSYNASFESPDCADNKVVWEYHSQGTWLPLSQLSPMSNYASNIYSYQSTTSGTVTANLLISGARFALNNYQIRARITGCACSDLSSSTALIQVTQKPTVPATLSSNDIHASYFTVNWNHVGGATSYHIAVSNYGSSTYLYEYDYSVQGNPTVGTALTHTLPQGTLQPNSTYKFAIKAYNSICGFTEYSSQNFVTTTNPFIEVSATSITFSDTEQFLCSSPQSYSISASGLDSPVIVTAPLHYAISKNNITYTTQSSPSLTYSISELMTSQPLFVKFCPQTAGSKNYSITHQSAYSNNPNVAVYGRSRKASPTVNSSNILFISEVPGAGATTNLTFNWSEGNGSDRVVVLSLDNPVTYVPPVDWVPNGATTNLSQASTLVSGSLEYLVFVGNGANTLTVSNIPAGRVVWVKIWDYNWENDSYTYYNQSWSSIQLNPNRPLYLKFAQIMQALPYGIPRAININSTDRSGGLVTSPANVNVTLTSVALAQGCSGGTYQNNTGTLSQGLSVLSLNNFTWYGSWTNATQGCTTGGVQLTATPSSNLYFPGYSNQFAYIYGIEPSVQSTYLTLSAYSCQNGLARLAFRVARPGNGSNFLVVARESGTVTIPSDGRWYSGNLSFGLGDNIGDNSYAVYSGPINTNLYIITGLSSYTPYYVRVFNYNGTQGAYSTTGFAPTNYNLSSAIFSNVTLRTVRCKEASNYVGIEFNGMNLLSIDKKVIADWETQTEKGIFGFELYRATETPESSKEPDFVKITSYMNNTSLIATNNISGSKYRFVDNDPTLIPGSEYIYKLAYVSADGQYDLDKKRINILTAPNKSAAVYMSDIKPNPASSDISFKLEVGYEQAVSIQILDITGRVVMEYMSSQMLGVGVHDISIPMKEISSGTYLIHVTTEVETIMAKFAVMK
ncbi:MAG: domain containing protein [Ignavibacteria bacterium]|nr:domain containing protein [Ignavibacteria bacterium]